MSRNTTENAVGLGGGGIRCCAENLRCSALYVPIAPPSAMPFRFRLKRVLPTSTLSIFSSPQVPRKPVLAYQTHILLHGETYLDLMISVKRKPPEPRGQTSSMHKWQNNGERNHKTSSSGAINCTGRTIVGDGGEKESHLSER